MVTCSLCQGPATAAVRLLCCDLTTCLPCATPGFYGGPKNCPKCQKPITEEEEGFVADPETAQKVARLSAEWQRWKSSEARTPEETERLREAVQCRMCLEACVKAVSLPCCTAAACRRCALASIKEDGRRCWGCGGTGDVLAPSHLVNNGLVRFAVDYLKSGKQLGDDPDFKVFALLSESKKPRPGKELEFFGLKKVDGRKEKQTKVKLTGTSTWGTSLYAFDQSDNPDLDAQKKDPNKRSREWYSLPDKKISTSEQLMLDEKMKRNAELETRREPKAMTESEKRSLKKLQEREKEKAAQAPPPAPPLLDLISPHILLALEEQKSRFGMHQKPSRVYKPKAEARKKMPAPPLLDLNSPHILLALEERKSRLGKHQKPSRVYKPKAEARKKMYCTRAEILETLKERNSRLANCQEPSGAYQTNAGIRNRNNSSIHGHVTRASSFANPFPTRGTGGNSDNNVTEWSKIEEKYSTYTPLARGWDTDR